MMTKKLKLTLKSRACVPFSAYFVSEFFFFFAVRRCLACKSVSGGRGGHQGYLLFYIITGNAANQPLLSSEHSGDFDGIPQIPIFPDAIWGGKYILKNMKMSKRERKIKTKRYNA
jgi:hypothetical protein